MILQWFYILYVIYEDRCIAIQTRALAGTFDHRHLRPSGFWLGLGMKNSDFKKTFKKKIEKRG